MTKRRNVLMIIVFAGIMCGLNISALFHENLEVKNNDLSPKASVGEFIISYPTGSSKWGRGGNYNIQWTGPLYLK